MKAMNFYTANGWAGSNYDSKLSTKEIAAKVRAYAKKNFPVFKFSVRYEWSMYTDSLYIELKEGAYIPFVQGSRSAERGYMSTMSSVKGWEDELTPEVFKVLDAVTTYASSFRYDDSDGMQDYYDTNFFLKIKVSDEYKVIEPKAKKSSVKPEKVEEAKDVEAVMVEGLEIVDYSEKAVVVFGDTKAIKDQLKELGGRFNPALKHNGEKRAGWIFGKKQADKVKKLMAPTELPALPEAGQKKITIKEGDLIAFKADSFQVSLNRSLYHDLPGIIEMGNKIEAGSLSVSSFYTPIIKNVEFYEKKVTGKRYITENKPKRGYYYVIDTLDNCPVEFFQTKEEAEREAEILNTHVGENGRLRSII